MYKAVLVRSDFAGLVFVSPRSAYNAEAGRELRESLRVQADLVIIKGAGELASGVGACLHSVGFRVLMTEISMPLAIRRTVCFSEAIYDGQAIVEGIVARRADSVDDIHTILCRDEIAGLVDPEAEILTQIAPSAVIDAIMAKKNLGTHLTDAPIVIALGPGFVAGRDAHAVIETNRGHIATLFHT